MGTNTGTGTGTGTGMGTGYGALYICIGIGMKAGTQIGTRVGVVGMSVWVALQEEDRRLRMRQECKCLDRYIRILGGKRC